MHTDTAAPEIRSQTLQIQRIEQESQFAELKLQWNALLERALRKSFFLTWEWQFKWWQHYCKVGNAKQLCIFTLTAEDGTLEAILPLYKVREGSALTGLQLLKFIGSGHESSEYLDLICSESVGDAALRSLYEATRETGVDGLFLSDLREDSLLLSRLQKWGRQEARFVQQRYWKTCPHIELPQSYDDFIAALSKNMRYNVRRRTRNLDKCGDVRFYQATSNEQAVDAVRVLYALHRKRWQVKEGTSKFDDPVREEFHAGIVGTLLDAGYLRFYLLAIDDVPVATLYCFHYAGHVYYYQAGMDTEWEKKSIGLVIMGRAIEASIAENAHEYDFLRGLEDYKFRWTSSTRDTWILELAYSSRAANFFRLGKNWRQTKKTVKHLLEKVSGKPV